MTGPPRDHSNVQPRRDGLIPPPERSAAEEGLVQTWRERRAECRPLKFDATTREKAVELRPRRKDPELTQAHLAQAFGTADPDLQGNLLNQVTSCYWKRSDEQAVNTSLAALCSIAPRDAVEGLLAVQMVAVHNVAMEHLRRTMISDQTPCGIEAGVNRATKLLRTFAAEVEALQRYRGRGSEQRVTVEHVHVGAGGQAIVGSVTKIGGEGGALQNG